MDDATYRPRFGRSYDEWRTADAVGDRLLDHPCDARGPCVPGHTPCSLSPFCSQPNFHLGKCDDAERIELVTVWDGETGELFYDPSAETEVPERPFFERRRTGT